MRELMLRYLGNDPVSAAEMELLNATLLESAERRSELLEMALQHECLHELLEPAETRRQPLVTVPFLVYKIAAVMIIGLSVYLAFFLSRPPANIAQARATELEETVFFPFTHFPLLASTPPEISLADVSENPYRLGIHNTHAQYVARLITPDAVLWAPDIRLH